MAKPGKTIRGPAREWGETARMKSALIGVIGLIAAVNAAVLAVGRGLGIVCVGVMVSVILVQVFFRYVLGDALAWTEEGARFLMLWMTGLMAPTAFRRGGFVAIEMLGSLLPRRGLALLSLLLLSISLTILIAGFQIGWAQVTGFAGKFATDTLWVPTSFAPLEWMKVPRSWAMGSMVVGIGLLMAVNVELMLRAIASLAGLEDRLPTIAQDNAAEAV